MLKGKKRRFSARLTLFVEFRFVARAFELSQIDERQYKDKGMSQPLFSPSSVFWRVNRELASGLAGPRAVLMQIAHPLIAAGVAEHSQFRSHRFARLYRTALAAAAITFGSREFALRVVRLINQKHQQVHGLLPSAAGPFPAGTPYDANDPELKLWVLSTVTDSTLLQYDTFVSPLSNEECGAYYRDSLIAAKLFGIPDKLVPETYADFRRYMNEMLASDVITVSDTAREIAQALFSPSVEGRLLLLGSEIGIGLLPERLRREFGFRWTPRHDKWLGRSARLSRRVREHVPSILCASPFATLSHLRALVVP
jgi:uncharacterized protein (DUF2236 family)